MGGKGCLGNFLFKVIGSDAGCRSKRTVRGHLITRGHTLSEANMCKQLHWRGIKVSSRHQISAIWTTTVLIPKQPSPPRERSASTTSLRPSQVCSAAGIPTAFANQYRRSIQTPDILQPEVDIPDRHSDRHLRQVPRKAAQQSGGLPDHDHRAGSRHGRCY